MSLSDVLRGVPELSGSDIEILLQAGSQLQNIADLCNNDIFLDCPVTENIALVALAAISALCGESLREGLKEWLQIALYFLVGERVMATALELGGEKWARSAVAVFLGVGALVVAFAVAQYFSPEIHEEIRALIHDLDLEFVGVEKIEEETEEKTG